MGQLDKEFAATDVATKTAHPAPATATHQYAFFDALTQLTLQQKRQRQQQRQRCAAEN